MIETAQRNMDADSMKDAASKLRKGEFTLDDFLKQLKQIRKLGSFQSILGMLPGMGKFKDQLKDIDLDGKEIKHIEAIILSMTPEERADVRILNGSRRKRIANGAGVQIQDVNRMMKQFAEMQKTMKKMKGKMGGKGGKKLDPSKLGSLAGFPGMFNK